jgi:hypothetical protein
MFHSFGGVQRQPLQCLHQSCLDLLSPVQFPLEGCWVSTSRMDDFYELSPISEDPLLSSISTLFPPLNLAVAILLAPFAIVLATRLLSERVSEKVNGKPERTVLLLPY